MRQWCIIYASVIFHQYRTRVCITINMIIYVYLYCLSYHIVLQCILNVHTSVSTSYDCYELERTWDLKNSWYCVTCMATCDKKDWTMWKVDIVLTIVYGPHVSRTSPGLFPEKPCSLCQGSIGQWDWDSCPPTETQHSMLILYSKNMLYIYSEWYIHKQSCAHIQMCRLFLTRCSCQRNKWCCEVDGVQHRALADIQCEAKTRNDPGL